MNNYFGIGIYHPKTEENVGTLFRTAYCFGASFVFTIGRRYKPQRSDTTNTVDRIPIYHYSSFSELSLPIGCQLIGIELTKDSQSLTKFNHPIKSCYILGSEDHGLPQKILNECHHIVQIPNAKECLNVSVAGSIILYDRNVKLL